MEFQCGLDDARVRWGACFRQSASRRLDECEDEGMGIETLGARLTVTKTLGIIMQITTILAAPLYLYFAGQQLGFVFGTA